APRRRPPPASSGAAPAAAASARRRSSCEGSGCATSSGAPSGTGTSEEDCTLAAVRGGGSDDLVALHQHVPAEVLGGLAGLGVAQPHRVADPQRLGGGAHDRGLHLP